MQDRNIIVALDVGTTKVCTIVGSKNNLGELEIIGIGSHPSHGLKKGCVVNIDKTIRSIRASLEEAKLMAGVSISNVTVGIAGNHIYSFNSSGAVPVKNPEITQSDIDRVIEAAKAVVIPTDREIIHIIPQEFKVDNAKGIKNPLGMCGVRLEANVHIVTGSVSLIQNLVKCIEESDVNAQNIILQPIASSNAVLTQEEKEIGVVLIDIGGGTTDVAIWKDGSLLHTQIIPVGGNHFTNDLAVALKVSHTEAERIKINHGHVLPGQIYDSSHITVNGLVGSKPREIQMNYVGEVFSARAEELFDLINSIVEETVGKNQIAGGFVITGGGALIKGTQELAEYILETPTRIGYPISFGGMTNVMQNPQYSTVLGLLIEAAKNVQVEKENSNFKTEGNELIKKLSDSIRSVFKEIF